MTVKCVREEIKLEDKAHYDKAHKTLQPAWKVGDYMLLKDDTYKPGASQVLTKQHFTGSFIIQKVVKGRPDVGEAYQLVGLTEWTRKKLPQQLAQLYFLQLLYVLRPCDPWLALIPGLLAPHVDVEEQHGDYNIS